MHPNVHSIIIYNSQDMKQSKCPSTEDWIKKMWYIMEYYSAIKKNENFAICNNMDGLGGYYA